MYQTNAVCFTSYMGKWVRKLLLHLIGYNLKSIEILFDKDFKWPWSRSVAVTVSTVVPGPLFSMTWVSNSALWNTGASSLTSITCTHSTWEVDSWGIPWSSAMMVRLYTSCSSRSRALRIDREPTNGKDNYFDLNGLHRCVWTIV